MTPDDSYIDGGFIEDGYFEGDILGRRIRLGASRPVTVITLSASAAGRPRRTLTASRPRYQLTATAPEV